jgi:hypothetical protein
MALASWVATPRFLRHMAHVEPLFFETVPLPPGDPAGGVAVRVDLPPSRWSAGTVEVLEDGRALERAATGREVRTDRGGRYHARDGVLLFSSTEGSDPHTNGRRYELRRPRDLERSTEIALAVSFATLQAALFCALLATLCRRRQATGIDCIAIAAIAAGGTLWLLDDRLPESSADVLGEKLRQYRKVAREIDAVFLGSSRVYRHLDPATFAATFAEHGETASAFNLGVPDMRMLEVLYLAERVLERSPGLRLLVVEPEEDPLFIRDENRLTQRVRRWHDLSTLQRVLPEIWRTESPTAERILILLDRLDLVAHRVSLVGRGVDLIDALLRRSARWIEPEHRGFLSLDEDRQHPRTEADRIGLERRFRDLHEAVPAWEQALERLRRSSPEGSLTDPYELRLFDELQQLADRHGVELVFVVSPRIGRLPNLVHAWEAGIVDRLVRFDDPERYPDFYELSDRYDRHHLDGDAARRMTRLLALELLERAAPRDGIALDPPPESGS